MAQFKLGKKPAREGAYSFKLTRYLTTLPAAPAVFGHQALVTVWGMLGNDRVGDCVFAGAAHETILWNREAGANIPFTTKAVLSDYSAVTGYTPADPSTDQGTDMQAAASYRRKTGIVDGNSSRHTVDAYLELPGVSARGGNDRRLLDSIASAAYLFGAVGIGVEFPHSAMDQFDNGQPWDLVPGSPIDGGHYVPLIGRVENGNFLVITWGKVQEVTPAFLLAYVDEAVAYISLERLKDGKSLEGFDVDALRADLDALANGSAPAPAPVDPLAALRAVLDPWAAARHTGCNRKAANAWKAYVAALS